MDGEYGWRMREAFPPPEPWDGVGVEDRVLRLRRVRGRDEEAPDPFKVDRLYPRGIGKELVDGWYR